MKNARTILDQFLERYGKPPVKDMESAGERVWKSVLAGEGARLDEPSHSASTRPARRLGWPAFATGIAAIALAVFLPATVLRSAPAVLEDAAGSRNVGYGELVRSNGGGTLKFTDGARVEMRAESEVSFERRGDGVLVRVRKGDVIANAAEQANGQVYVETKDMSAVGNVFLVNAQEEGSRVAAITGETRIQQGATEKKLLPGEQVATSPGMGSLPIKERIGWSRQAEAQLALLPQSTAAPAAASQRESFEVVSIRPSNQGGLAPGARGSGGNNVRLAGNGCAYAPPEIDPRRFAIADTNVWSLITIAYGGNLSPQGCADLTALNLISGGPGWIKSDKWDIEATIPAGPPTYTAQQLRRGEAPKFRRMMLTLLEDRFQLVVRREMKEVAAYALTAEAGAPKFIVPGVYAGGFDDPDFKKYIWDSRQPGASPSDLGIVAKEASMAEVTTQLARATGRPVLDRTGIAGPVSFILNYDPRLGPTSKAPNPNAQNLGQPFAKGLEQIGFKLTDTRTTVETWVIERVEKPSEN
jgi:uncharacterized protein (TIGR03435 family)